jgi:hypothetical protein
MYYTSTMQVNRLGLCDAQRRDRVGPAETLLETADEVTVIHVTVINVTVQLVTVFSNCLCSGCHCCC